MKFELCSYTAGYYRPLDPWEVPSGRKYRFIVEKEIRFTYFTFPEDVDDEYNPPSVVRNIIIPPGFLTESENILPEWLFAKQAFTDGLAVSEADVFAIWTEFLAHQKVFWGAWWVRFLYSLGARPYDFTATWLEAKARGAECICQVLRDDEIATL